MANIDPQRWIRIKDIFGEAAEVPPEDRPDLLLRLCDGDAALFGEVEHLLSLHERPDLALDRPLPPALAGILRPEKTAGSASIFPRPKSDWSSFGRGAVPIPALICYVSKETRGGRNRGPNSKGLSA